MIFVVDRDRCIGCEECVAICPVGALSIQERKAKIDMRLCLSCGACKRECGEEAIDMLSTRTGEFSYREKTKEEI